MVALGVSGGFVTSTPSGDPTGSQTLIDESRASILDSSPASINTVTEMGWYCRDATSEANYELGIYTDEGNGEPETLLGGVSRTNAKGTGIGWKTVVGLNILISASTNYWLAVQCDVTSSNTFVRNTTSGGNGTAATFNGVTTLPSDWGTSGFTTNDNILAIYAIAEAVEAGVTIKIKIAGTFQDKPIKVKIGGTFVEKTLKVKVGGTFQ